MHLDEPRLRLLTPALLCAVGVAAFFLVTGGGAILRPTNIDWLTSGDPAQNWLGWQFFRTTPLLQWPLGLNPGYGAEISTSIVYTDSLPLLALIFKTLQPLLPDQFQYLGFWLLVCFVLQPLFAWKLLSNFTRDPRLLLVGSLFFLIAPIFLWRLHGHYALCSHWLLLWALHLYFRQAFAGWIWVVLVALAALIHGYFVPMVFAIFLADLAQRAIRRKISLPRAGVHLFATVACLGLVAWSVGYFVVSGGMQADGFGRYRMNLLAPIDPDSIWSHVLRDQDGKRGDYEGFNFLGLGIILLAVIASAALVRGARLRLDARLAPILVISVGLFLFALSNNVGLGPKDVLSFDMPSFANILTNAFRSSGRFFWPVYYLLYSAVFYILFRYFNSRRVFVACVLLLALQVVDSNKAWRYFRAKFAHSAPWSSPLKAPFWANVGARYKKLVVVLPTANLKDWYPLGRFAMEQGMTINAVYMSRVDPDKLARAKRRVADEISENRLDPRTLYIFQDRNLWRAALPGRAKDDVVGIVDGFRIIAPGLKACRECSLEGVRTVDASYVPTFRLGETIDFTDRNRSADFLRAGWHQQEPWGIWSRQSAIVALRLSETPTSDVVMRVEGRAWLVDRHPNLSVAVIVNGTEVGRLDYTLRRNDGVRSVTIPRGLVLKDGGRLRIRFKNGKINSPAELGLSSDARRLGLGVVSLKFEPARP